MWILLFSSFSMTSGCRVLVHRSRRRSRCDLGVALHGAGPTVDPIISSGTPVDSAAIRSLCSIRYEEK